MGIPPGEKKMAGVNCGIDAVGESKTSFLVSHRLPLSAAPDAYKKFDARSDGFSKAVLKPGLEVH
jgi:threonine dehydrogenase-like Zn-dependent dehydrogenase